MTIYMGRLVNQRKVPTWLPFKNYNVHIFGTYVHITKHEVSEVSMFNPLARRAMLMISTLTKTTHDGQIMIT